MLLLLPATFGILDAMNSTLVKILNAREDLSEFVFHFTKEETAFGTLLKIIADNAIIDINATGNICFTEAPLTVLPKMFDIFNSYLDPLYAPYGIGIRKETLFELGARPVIYGKPEEINELPENLHWRFQKFVPGVSDYTWLREWRIPKPRVDLSFADCFIVTKTKIELNEVMYDLEDFDIDIDGCVTDGQFDGYAVATSGRRFKGVSLEDLSELESMSKAELQKHLGQQTEADVVRFNLGSI